MNERKHFIRCISLLSIVCGINASLLHADIPAAYVDIGYGARPVGMGGAFVALANDAHAVLWNPAGLMRLKDMHATFMWAKQFNLIPYYFVAAGCPITPLMAGGAAAISSGNSALQETTFLLSFAYKLPQSIFAPLNHFTVGVNIKMRNSSFGNNADGGENRIQGSAIGFGMDCGLQWKLSSKFYTGLLMRDLISPLNYHNKTLNKTYTETVPPALIIGAACAAMNNLLLTIDWNKSLSADTHDRLCAGMEYKILNLLVLRGGINQTIHHEADRKYAVGLGLVYTKKGLLSLSFDFAYEFFFLENTPRVAISIWF